MDWKFCYRCISNGDTLSSERTTAPFSTFTAKSSIVMSPSFYKHIIKYERHLEENLVKRKSEYGYCYMGNMIIPNFENWIKNGMKD